MIWAESTAYMDLDRAEAATQCLHFSPFITIHSAKTLPSNASNAFSSPSSSILGERKMA